MNRRDLLKSMLAAALGSCVRWMPLPELPQVAETAQTMTLLEWAQGHPGNIDSLVDILCMTNPILDDMPWTEGPLPTRRVSAECSDFFRDAERRFRLGYEDD